MDTPTDLRRFPVNGKDKSENGAPSGAIFRPYTTAMRIYDRLAYGKPEANPLAGYFFSRKFIKYMFFFNLLYARPSIGNLNLN